MATRNLLVVLTEISDTIRAIESASRGKTERSLDEDWLLKHGIERGLEIISEAARHLPDDLLARAPEIPWKQVRGIGNVLRHEYHRIANPVIWAVVTDQLPPLRAAVDRLKDHLPD